MATDLPHTSRELARNLLDSPEVRARLDAHVESLAADAPHLDPRALRVGLLAALADEAQDRATHAARDARAEPPVPWQQLADALGRSVSAVRHRYDTGTVAARRHYDQKRRAP